MQTLNVSPGQPVNRLEDARWLRGMNRFSLFRPTDADIWPIWLFDLWPQPPAEQTGGFPLGSLGLMSFPSARFKISLINTAHRSVTTGINVTDGGDRGGGRGGGEVLAFSFDPPLPLLLLKLRCSVWSTINQRISECDLLSCSPWGVRYKQFEALQITDCRDCGRSCRVHTDDEAAAAARSESARPEVTTGFWSRT